MFLELYKPQVVDRQDTKDRVKVRIGEPGATGRFWLNLTFNNKEELANFVEQLNFELHKTGEQLEYKKGA